MTVEDMDAYINEENCIYLIIETFNDMYFGFCLSEKNTAEYKTV